MRRYGLVALLWVVGGLILANAWGADAPTPKPQLKPIRGNPPVTGVFATPTRTVEMVIDYGDGVQVRFTALGWKEKMTVLDAVTTAGAHAHGVKATLRGSGATAFVTQFGDLKNEGGGEKSRNWLYSVNNAEGEVSAGAATVKPGDVILWRFGVPDNNDNLDKDADPN
jgi:Domain of unknown function (DUF4430)